MTGYYLQVLISWQASSRRRPSQDPVHLLIETEHHVQRGPTINTESVVMLL